MQLRYFLLAAAYLAVVGSFVAFASLDEDLMIWLSREDYVVENAGSLFFLAGAILCLVAYALSRDQDTRFFGVRTKRNLYFLLLGLLLFACFGEEISWGQRIFGWETPDSWKENVQGETNLHNLRMFNVLDFDGSWRPRLARPLNFNTLLAVFTLTYCIIVPLLHGASGHIRRFLDFAGVPIPPVAIGGLFAAAYVTFRLVLVTMGVEGEAIHPVDELKEAVYGLIFAILSIHFLATVRAANYRGFLVTA